MPRFSMPFSSYILGLKSHATWERQAHAFYTHLSPADAKFTRRWVSSHAPSTAALLIGTAHLLNQLLTPYLHLSLGLSMPLFFCLLPLFFSCRLSLPLSLWLCSDYSCCRDLVPLFYSLKSHLVCFYLSLLLIESLLTGSFWSVL